jgi:hypothetical protein
MSSELQQLASRTNGAKSHGPLTEEGKQASSRNSRRHGLLSKKVVLEGESQEEFDALLASYLEEHQPRTATEATLVENMAVARWRQERVWSLETAAFDHQIRRPKYMEGDDFSTRTFVAFRTLADEGRSLDLLNRYDTRFERQFRAALTALLNLQSRRRAEERASHPPDADPPAGGVKRTRLYWLDEEGNPTLQADTHPGRDLEPEPDRLAPAAAPGSFGNPKACRENVPPGTCRRPPNGRRDRRKSAPSNSRQFGQKTSSKPFGSCNFTGHLSAPLLVQYSLQMERLLI